MLLSFQHEQYDTFKGDALFALVEKERLIVGLNSIFLPSLRSNGLSQSSSFQSLLRHVFCHLSRTTPPPSCMLRRLFLLHAKKPNFITSQSITLSSMIQVHLKNLKKKPTSLKILFKVVLCRSEKTVSHFQISFM